MGQTHSKKYIYVQGATIDKRLWFILGILGRGLNLNPPLLILRLNNITTYCVSILTYMQLYATPPRDPKGSTHLLRDKVSFWYVSLFYVTNDNNSYKTHSHYWYWLILTSKTPYRSPNNSDPHQNHSQYRYLLISTSNTLYQLQEKTTTTTEPVSNYSYLQ